MINLRDRHYSKSRAILSVMTLLKDLNPSQKEAVSHSGSPLLILAGAGSGKTRVLTTRIASLIKDKGVPADRILAATFTNKAAGEMRKRLHSMLGEAAQGLWLGTFHSLGLRLIKRESSLLGLPPDLTVYDDDDQLRLVKQTMEELDISTKALSPRAVLSRIGRAKNENITPGEYLSENHDFFSERVSQIYALYQKRLKEMGAVDFGDLICLPIRLFRESPETLERYQRRFLHTLVDEYQDTNRAQYALMNLLALGSRNLCAVGDPDQSIYRWRGADIGNILEFEQDWPDSTVLRLEQNYRSTERILLAANSVISHNAKRHEKTLWTENPKGTLPEYIQCENEYKEARGVLERLRELRSEKASLKYKDFAVFYRTNAQSRVLEEQFAREGVPYSVVGGVRFYERMEIKDALSYLKVIQNPRDAISLKRIVNVPARGIGAVTLARVGAAAREKGLSLYEAFTEGVRSGELKRPEQARLFNTLEKIREETIGKKNQEAGKTPLHELALRLLDEIGYMEMWETQATEEAYGRIENLHELISAIKDFELHEAALGHPDEDEDGAKGTTLSRFLERVALISDLDSYNNTHDRATLMTLHSAKGLEFPVVFIVGAEEGLFPHSRSTGDEDELEEERRLCYVGMTRARERLFFFSAATRNVFGETRYQTHSRFIEEIAPELIERPELKEKLPTEPYYTLEDSQLNPLTEDFSGDFPNGQGQGVNDTWRVGMKVRHLSFGVGIVKAREGTGEDTKLTIKFRGGSEKKIVVRYAQLTAEAL